MAWESETSDAVPDVYEASFDLTKSLPAAGDESERGEAPEKVISAPFQKFSEEVQRLLEEAGNYKNCELEVKTYFDLQGFNLDSLASRSKKQPGSLQMMYMFYSRIFEKLVGKQKGVELALFSPVDFDQRLLGFRAVLEWAKDFRMMPQRVAVMA
eukprot:Skav208460  [mRNA]  locus=scaffold1104:207934:211714:+ [translate_table: standard]